MHIVLTTVAAAIHALACGDFAQSALSSTTRAQLKSEHVLHVSSTRSCIWGALAAISSNVGRFVATARVIGAYIGGQHPNIGGGLVGDAHVTGACDVVITQRIVGGACAHAAGATGLARGAGVLIAAPLASRQRGLHTHRPPFQRLLSQGNLI